MALSEGFRSLQTLKPQAICVIKTSKTQSRANRVSLSDSYLFTITAKNPAAHRNFHFPILCAKMRKELKRRHLRVIICKTYRSSKMFTCVKSQKACKAKLIKAIFRLTPDTCIATRSSKGVTVIENRRSYCGNGNYRSRRCREFELHFI